MFGQKQNQNIGSGSIAIQAGGDVDLTVHKRVGMSSAEVQALVKTSIAAIEKKHSKQIQNLVEDKKYLESQLEKVVRDLVQQSNKQQEPNDFYTKTEQALNHLVKGDTLRAENLFLEIEKNEISKLNALKQRAISAAMNRGSLAYMRNTKSAVEAYERVVELDPDNIVALGKLSYLYFRQDKLKKAEKAHKDILKLAKKDSDMLNIAAAYCSLGAVYFKSGHIKESITMQRRSLQLRRKLNDQRGIISSYIELANVLIIKGKNLSAKKFTSSAIILSKKQKDPLLIAHVNATAGIIHSTLHEYEDAEMHFNEALNLFIKSNEVDGIAGAYGNLGILYKNKGNLVKAKKMYKLSLGIERKLGRTSGIASDLLNLANLHNQEEEYSLAIKQAKKSLLLFKKLKSKKGISGVYTSLGSSYFGKENFSRAVELFTESFKLDKEIGNKHAQAKVLCRLAEVHVLLNNIKKSKSCLEKAAVLAVDSGDMQLSEFIKESLIELDVNK